MRDACRKISYVVSRILWRIEYSGEENIPEPGSGAYIIASNHQTYVDPVWIAIPIAQDTRFLAWDEVFKWPIIGRLIPGFGAMPVKLEKGSTLGTLRKSLEVLKKSIALVIFPEGGRARPDGELLEFKAGVAKIAIKANVPVLPVTISGGNKIWPRGYLWPRPRKLRVHYHPLMETNGITDSKESAAELTRILKSTIRSGF